MWMPRVTESALHRAVEAYVGRMAKALRIPAEEAAGIVIESLGKRWVDEGTPELPREA